MLSKIFSAAIVGLDAQMIEVEVETSYGLPRFILVGLPDKAVEESKERVGAAIKSSGYQAPNSQPVKVLVGLAPADLKKEGSIYDLPVALGFLAANQQISFNFQNRMFAGELSLDGKLRPIKGALSFALLAKEKGFTELFLPKANAKEAAIIEGINTIGADSLKDVVHHLVGKKSISAAKKTKKDLIEQPIYPVDMGWIKGQEYAKRALEIAAAGGHNLIMQGPPGTGKTLLAQALPSILPQLTFEESLEVTKIYSVAGLLPPEKYILSERPFRSPHHTSSEVALIGGGNPPRPGEITLAHRGVLFMDEFPEFHRDVLESMRQPLEEGSIGILRSRQKLNLPARFMLVAAANPCPCGYYRDPERLCTCQPSQIAKYNRKLSGPLMDRFDLFIHVPQLKYDKLMEPDTEGISAQIREKVGAARQIQQARYQEENIFTNGEMRIPHIKRFCQLDTKSQGFIRKFVDSGRLSMRGYHRLLKTARTIADLEGSENIQFEHLSEALSYRLRGEAAV